MEVVSTVTTFDSTYGDDGDYKEKSAVECKPLLFWLYVAFKYSLEDGVKKIDTQPCKKLSLVQQLKMIEVSILS